MRKRPLVRERNFKIDFVNLFAYTMYGKFVKGIHRLPLSPGGSSTLPPGIQPDRLSNFFLKSFLNGYRYTSLIVPWNT
jgi:hypothetical protein